MKIYLIGLYTEKYEAEDWQDVKEIVQATTSWSEAEAYCEREVERFRSNKSIVIDMVKHWEGDKQWYIDYHYNVKEGDKLFGRSYEWIMRIEEVDLIGDKDVPDSMKPILEHRCEELTKEVDELRTKYAKLKGIVSEAQPHLTFYDGGVWEDFEHIRQSMLQARSVLRKADEY